MRESETYSVDAALGVSEEVGGQNNVGGHKEKK